MKLFRLLFLNILILFSLPTIGQQGNITGMAKVERGANNSYFVTFPQTSIYSNVTWSITGGTSIPDGQYGCIIQWDNDDKTGIINVYEDLFNQETELYVQIGDVVPSVSPFNQILPYNSIPAAIGILFNFAPVGSVSYQWQEWSFTLLSWLDISGQTTNVFQPLPAAKNRRYRCLVDDGKNIHTSLVSEVLIPDLLGGTLTLQHVPNYNTIPSIAATSATGGYCSSSNYSYVWEQSVENGPWTKIGTSTSYPGTKGIKGNTKVRRGVACGTQLLYSNELFIEPAYTSVDHENLNYVREIIPDVKDIISWQEADQLGTDHKSQTTTYFDGLGRTIQIINKEASLQNGIKNDVVNHFEYDEAGRQEKTFLPYATTTTIGKFKNDATTAQAQYITNLFGENPSYGLNEFDNSPLNRITKSMLPGNSWAGNNMGISSKFDLNNSNEKVHVWQVDYAAGSLPTTSPIKIYGTGQLFKNISEDEKGKQVINYTDKSGNLILKKVQDKNDAGSGLTTEHGGWLCTYYVYDDFGRLRFIIPPKAVVYLDTHNWVLSQEVAYELCFSNEYDARGRLIIKKSPGADAVYYVYDIRDRLIFSQDGNQRNETPKKWIATLYDNLDRPTLTGIIEYNSTRDALQGYVTNLQNSGSNDAIMVNSTTPPIIDLVINERDNTTHEYKAEKSITFNPGFESENSADFVAEIMNTSIAQNNSVEVNGNPLPPGSNLYTLSLTFYDDYSYSGAKTFSSGFTIDNTVPSDESEEVQSSLQTVGYVTGTKVRLLDDSNTFLTTTSYYDSKGRNIQVIGDNHKGFTDESTTQYDFSGKVRSTYEVTRFEGTEGIKIFTKNTYDILGRVTAINKSINGSQEKTIATYSYDALGRLSNKKLAPGFAGPDGPHLESLDYTYNIHGWLLGINKEYASSSGQSGHFFGMELGYDKSGTPGFTQTQTNGNIAGTAWKSRSDNTFRKYDFTYDNVNQLLNAGFNQQNLPGAGWTKDKMDFTSDYTYDVNGNIKTQNQWGVAPGSAPQQIDQLTYHYDIIAGDWTNKLKRIEEVAAAGANGKLGDFKNGSAGASAQQYSYDYNGNLQKDLNKEIGNAATPGIEYNFMNLPKGITFKNTNKTIEYIYDAAGNKLRKILNEPANGTNPTRHTETDYLNGFVYQNNELQFFIHEEGRVRMINPVGSANEPNYNGGGIPLPNGKQGVFDYFIKDHLTNVRMILTEEVKRNNDIATMEDADPNIKQHEESVFGNLTNNEVDVTRFAKPTEGCSTYAEGWISNTSAKVSKLSGLTNKIGPNVILKVMSGDKISATSDYYFKTKNNTASNNNLLNDIVMSLIGVIVNGNTTNVLKGSSGIIQSTLSNVSTSPLNDLLSPQRPTEPVASAPRGYLNIVFFDEQFNYVNSYFKRVSVSCDAARDPLRLLYNEAPKNGWCYIYLSNESDEPVYFDNFQVAHERGRIIEENHFYAYGLKNVSISSSALPSTLNNYLYQGDFSEHDDETGYNEFFLRHYDPQIGRWTTMDPYEQFANPYLGMGNNPVSNVDPDGGLNIPVFADLGSDFLNAAGNSLIGGAIGYGIGRLAGGKEGGKWGAAIGFGVVAGSYVPWGDVGQWMGGLFNNDWFWHDLYKSGLIKYLNTADNNKLGKGFEDLFGEYAKSDPDLRASNVRRFPPGEKFSGGDRNTAPDFIGDAYVNDKPIRGADWYELKQKSGGLYLSSNNDQMKGHIDNLRISTNTEYLRYGKLGYQSKLTLITTADVKYSPGIGIHASYKRVLYEHRHAQYRMVNKQMKFRFKKVIGKNYNLSF